MTLTSLNTRLTAVEAKTQDMSRGTYDNTGQSTPRFTGVNPQIVDGSGDIGFRPSNIRLYSFASTQVAVPLVNIAPAPTRCVQHFHRVYLRRCHDVTMSRLVHADLLP